MDDAVKAEPNPEENEVGFAPQTDNNFLTFFAQSALPGLKVRTAEGEWIQPPAVPGTFVVNTGAMLARYSNDRFRAKDALPQGRKERGWVSMAKLPCPTIAVSGSTT